MQYTFGDFFGKISEDDKLVRTAQVLYAENLDLDSNTDFVTLAPQPKHLLTTQSKIQAIYFLERGINLPVFGDDTKKIYLNNQEKYTANHDVRMFWSNSKYLYWLDFAEDIYRILLTDINGDWSGKVENTGANLENDSGKAFCVEGEGETIIAYGKKIYKIDNSTGKETEGQFWFCYDEIVGLVDSREVVEIFQKDGKVFIWDRVSDRATSYDLGIHIAIVLQSADTRYIIGEGALYIMAGGTLNKVAGQYNSDVLQGNKFKFRELENSNIGFLKQIVYLGSDNIDSIKPADNFVEFGKSCVLSLGSKKSGLPAGITKAFNSSSDGSFYENIYGMTTKATNYSGYNDTLYIAYKNKNGVYGVDYVDLDEQNYITSKEGILILPKFDGGNKSLEKVLNSIKIRADFGADAGTFYFYKVVNGVLVPFKGDRNLSKISTQKGNNHLMVNENFFDITLAIVFKQDSNKVKNDALKLYSVTFNYEPTKR